jgi:hypothetical protein
LQSKPNGFALRVKNFGQWHYVYFSFVLHVVEIYWR